MACTWEPLIPEREKEKRSKYFDLAADIGRRESRWQLRSVAVVVGTMGTLGTLRHQLAQLGLWTPKEIVWLIQDLQYQAIKAGAQLI